MKAVPQLSSGLVIAGAYADKIRRVAFAQLRDEIKSGRIDSKQVAFRVAELNRLLFEILVNKLKLDKGDVVRVRIEYELRDGDIEWKLDTLRVEAFRRIPDEEVEKAVKEVVEAAKEVLESTPSAEEQEWTGAVAPPVPVTGAVRIGSTRSGDELYILTNGNERVGLAVVSGGKADIILVGEGEAYRATARLSREPSEEHVLEVARLARYAPISREEAEGYIRKKIEELY